MNQMLQNPQTEIDEKAAINEIMEHLRAPFPPGELGWKPGSISGNRALAMPYIDARSVMNRLDEVFGPHGWQDDYTRDADGSVVCRLQAKFPSGEWVTKTDVGGMSDQPDEGDRAKAAYSDALKRAAVKFGIGRYLYDLEPIWWDYDPQRKRFVSQPQIGGGHPQHQPPRPQQQPNGYHHAQSVPQRTQTPPVAQPQANGQGLEPVNGKYPSGVTTGQMEQLQELFRSVGANAKALLAQFGDPRKSKQAYDLMLSDLNAKVAAMEGGQADDLPF